MNREVLFKLINSLNETDKNIYTLTKKRWDSLAKPLNGLGIFEEQLCSIASIQKSTSIRLDKRAVLIMCADNGVVEEGVSQTGQEVTAIVSGNFSKADSASINIIAQEAEADVIAVDIGIAADMENKGMIQRKIAFGTKNFIKEDAMSEEELIKALYTGIDMVRLCSDMGYDIIAAGEMGIGNTTTSSAVCAAISGLEVSEVTGAGAGLPSEGIKNKIKTIEKGIRLRKPNHADSLDVIKKLGGFDIAGLCGMCIGAALYSMPLVLDGIITLTAAYAAVLLNPVIADYLIASHISKEPASISILKKLGKKGGIAAELGLGEGTGAAMYFLLLNAALAVYNKLPDFERIGVKAYKCF